jgi:hypothetical protein
MHYLTTYILIATLILLAACHSTKPGAVQSSLTKPQSTAAEGVAAKENFPKGWIGNWHGDLHIYGAKGHQQVPMWIEIQPIDTSTQGRYTFGLIYGSREKDWRPYELVPIDTSKGIWAVDEKNTIQMESYLRGPKFMCWFVVQGNRVLCSYELIDAQTLSFEVISGKETEVSKSGGVIRALEQDTIPSVGTFPIGVFQRAILKKM